MSSSQESSEWTEIRKTRQRGGGPSRPTQFSKSSLQHQTVKDRAFEVFLRTFERPLAEQIDAFVTFIRDETKRQDDAFIQNPHGQKRNFIVANVFEVIALHVKLWNHEFLSEFQDKCLASIKKNGVLCAPMFNYSDNDYRFKLIHYVGFRRPIPEEMKGKIVRTIGDGVNTIKVLLEKYKSFPTDINEYRETGFEALKKAQIDERSISKAEYDTLYDAMNNVPTDIIERAVNLAFTGMGEDNRHVLRWCAHKTTKPLVDFMIRSFGAYKAIHGEQYQGVLLSMKYVLDSLAKTDHVRFARDMFEGIAKLSMLERNKLEVVKYVASHNFSAIVSLLAPLYHLIPFEVDSLMTWMCEEKFFEQLTMLFIHIGPFSRVKQIAVFNRMLAKMNELKESGDTDFHNLPVNRDFVNYLEKNGISVIPKTVKENEDDEEDD